MNHANKARKMPYDPRTETKQRKEKRQRKQAKKTMGKTEMRVCKDSSNHLSFCIFFQVF